MQAKLPHHATPSETPARHSTPRPWLGTILTLTLMATGRAMTLAFIGRTGGGAAGDPPEAWLMPLVGDAAVGLTAPVVALLLWRAPRPSSWLAAVVWGAIAVFDAGAAYLVETSAPWPEFFMLELFGRSMFGAAIALHLVILALLARPEVRAGFGVPTTRANAAGR